MTVALSRVGWILIWLVLEASLFGCTNQLLSKPSGGVKIPELLVSLGGHYVLDAQAKQYRYSDKSKLDHIVTSEDRQHVLHVLVSCMDDETPTKTQLDGKFVILGILCYQAVTQIVYYEPSDRHGDVASHWPGYITPTASIEELRVAKKAWQQILGNKTYIFL